MWNFYQILKEVNRFPECVSCQCTPLSNSSECQNLSIFVTKRSSSDIFDYKVIIKIIRALKINKSHGHDGISISVRETFVNNIFNCL